MSEQMTFDANGEYKFEERPPIKGFPELHWTGKRPYKSTQYFPAQLVITSYSIHYTKLYEFSAQAD